MKVFSKFPNLNISKRNFLLVMCIAKNLIWTTLEVNFSIYIYVYVYIELTFNKNPPIRNKSQQIRI